MLLIKNFCLYLLGDPNQKIKFYVCLFNWAKRKNLYWVAKIVSIRSQKTLGVYFTKTTKIPNSTKFPHPTSIVLGDFVDLGENVVIYQNVTIGAARQGEGKHRKYPIVGENTIIFAGATIVGSIEIGENCVIGANTLVNKDIPSSSVVVGNPMRILLNSEKQKTVNKADPHHAKNPLA